MTIGDREIAVQLAHLWQVVEEMHLESEARRALARTVIASFGPTTSEELRRRGFAADIEASRPKMGILVSEAAALPFFWREEAAQSDLVLE